MTESFKNKQKIIHIILMGFILISFCSDQILNAANIYLSPKTASIVGFFVLVISAMVNQLVINKRVDVAEILKVEELSTILGRPLQEEIIKQTEEATEEGDCYNF